MQNAPVRRNAIAQWNTISGWQPVHESILSGWNLKNKRTIYIDAPDIFPILDKIRRIVYELIESVPFAYAYSESLNSVKACQIKCMYILDFK